MNLLTTFFWRFKGRLIWVLLAFCIVLGVTIANNYGMGWDEGTSQRSGFVTLSYLQNLGDPNPPLWTDEMRYYGVVFELPLAIVEKSFGMSDYSIYLFRHIATFLLFVGGVYVFYLLCLKRFKNEYWAILGPLFLLISPRIFADAFYNSKDIPAMVFFVFAIYTLVRYIEKPNYSRLLAHALVSALLIDIRLPGLFIVAPTVFYMGLQNFQKKWQWSNVQKTLLQITVYSVSLAGFVYMFWPFLWQHPIQHFIDAYHDMSHFVRQDHLEMLFAGQIIIASKVPWFYIPMWILITTPVAYLMGFFIGAGSALVGFLKNWKNPLHSTSLDIIIFLWFFGPLVAIITLKSVVYDGWRQLYFIYPALIYLSLVGFYTIVNLFRNFDVKVQKNVTKMMIGIVALNLIMVLSFMIRNHPYQNLYFNLLVGGQEKARENFDMDYWGLTFREGLRYIASHDTDEVIPIIFAGGSEENTRILPPKIADRFSIQSDPVQAKYILSNYRWQQFDLLPWDNEFYSVTVDGVKVMTVFRMF